MVLAEDVQAKFGSKVLHNKMTVGRLIDEGVFVSDAHELTYNINRVAARLRMHKKMKGNDDFLSSSEGEQAVKKKTTGKSSGSAAAVEVPLAKKETGKSSGSAAAVVDESDSDCVAEVAKSLGSPTGIYIGTDSGEGVKEI